MSTSENRVEAVTPYEIIKLYIRDKALEDVVLNFPHFGTSRFRV